MTNYQNYNNHMLYMIEKTSKNLDVLNDIITQYKQNPSTFPKTVSPQQEQTNETALETISQNPNIDTQIVDILLKQNSPYINQKLAANPKTSPSQLNQLSTKKDTRVIENILKNPNTETETIKDILKTQSPLLQAHYAQNPNIDAQTQSQYAQTLEGAIHSALSTNPNALPETLEEIFYNEPFEHVTHQILRHRNCPANILQKNFKSKKEEIQNSVMLNPNCPAATLEAIFFKRKAETDLRIKDKLAAHPNATPDLLDYLATNDHPELLKELNWNNSPYNILYSVINNPNTNPTTAYKIAAIETHAPYLWLSVNQNVNLDMMAIALKNYIEKRNPQNPPQAPITRLNDAAKLLAAVENAMPPEHLQETYPQLQTPEGLTYIKNLLSLTKEAASETLEHFLKTTIENTPNASAQAKQDLSDYIENKHGILIKNVKTTPGLKHKPKNTKPTLGF